MYIYKDIFIFTYIYIYLCVFIYTYVLCIYNYIYQKNRACCTTWQLSHSPSDLLHLPWGPLQALATLCIRGGETLKGPMPVIWKKHLPLIWPPPPTKTTAPCNADMFSQKDVRMFESLDFFSLETLRFGDDMDLKLSWWNPTIFGNFRVGRWNYREKWTKSIFPGFPNKF